MPIPYDPQNRWWVEASGQNPRVRNDFRPVLLAFVAYSPDREPIVQGCGFVIAGVSQCAVAITAKHVLFEGVLRAQRQLPAHAPSSLFIRPSSMLPSIEPEKLKVFWMGRSHASMLNVRHVECCDTLDIACVVCSPDDSDTAIFQPGSVPISIAVPSVGDVVHMQSLDNMDASEISPPTDRSRIGAIISIATRVSIRVGVVTGVYLGGYRQYQWPCFTTSIPAEPGMSGGPVVLPAKGNTVAACGIVCADNSTDEARSNNHQCGESVVACAWPALALRAPDTIPPTPTTPKHTLHSLMRSGRMPMADGGIDEIELIDLGNGDFRIGFRQQ